MSKTAIGKCAIILTLGNPALAMVGGHSPQSFTFQGQLTDSTGTAPLNDTVTIQVGIYDPLGLCLLYEDVSQPINLSATSGLFAIQVGSFVGDSKRVAGEDPGLSMSQVFSNAPNEVLPPNSSNCTPGYTPTTGDPRRLRVTVIPASTRTPVVLTPDQIIASTPHALVADTLQGLSPTDFLNLGADQLSQSNVENIFSYANYPLLIALLNGTSTQYVASSATSGAQLPSRATPPSDLPPAGSIWFNSQTHSLQYSDGTNIQTLGAGGGSSGGGGGGGGTVTQVGTGTGLLGGPITSAGVISVDVGTTPNKIVQLDAAGKLPAVSGSALINLNANQILTGTVSVSHGGTGTTRFGALGIVNADSTGNLFALTPGTSGQFLSGNTGGIASFRALSSSDIPELDWSTIANGKPVTLSGYGILDGVQNTGGTPSIQAGLFSSIGDPGVEGRIFISTDTQVIYRDSGLSWDVIASKLGSGGTVTAVTTNAPLLSSGGNTPNLSIARASGSSNGYLAAEDFTTFNNKLAGTLNNGSIFVGNASNQAAAVAISGDATISNSGVLTLRNTGTAGTYTKVTTDVQGRISSGGPLTLGDIPGGSDSDTGLPLVNNGLGTAPSYSALDLGGAAAAGTLAAARFPALSGDVITTAGSLSTVLSTTGVIPGIYTKIIVDAKGRVSSGDTLLASDLPAGTATQWTNQGSAIYYELGSVGIGVSSPSAHLELAAGESSVGSAPLKFSSGTLLSTPESGAIEFDGTLLYYTDQSGTRRSLAIGGMEVTTVTASAPLASSGGNTPNLSIARASGSSNGYLAAEDFTTFNNKLAGTLNNGSIFVGNASNQAAAVAITGDATISNSGVLTLKNTGTAGTYTKVTTDAQGRISSGGTLALADLPQGSALNIGFPLASSGAGLAPSYTALDLGSAAATGTLAAARFPALSGDLTTTAGSLSTTLSTTGVIAGAYTKVTVDSKGRISSGTTLSTSDLPAGTATQWTTSGSHISYTGGNVGIGTTNPTQSLSTTGDIGFSHLVSNTGTPTLTSFGNAGNCGGTVASSNISGNDTAMTVSYTTPSSGTCSSNSIIFTVTFKNNWNSPPVCVVSAGTSPAGKAIGSSGGVYITTTSSTLVLNNGTSAMTTNTNYTFNFICAR